MYNNEILSSISGYISIFSWIVVLFPQIWINYKRKSGDSLSTYFLCIWAVGDLLNFVGAILQGLLPTMILLPGYYIATDIVLLLQKLYYHYFYRGNHIDEIVVGETTPLINSVSELPEAPESLESLKLRRKSIIRQFFEIFFSIIGVCLAGVIAYLLTDKSQEVNNEPERGIELEAQIFGWTSAFLYLGSRIPQIWQNYMTKSTEGLSLAMFCFSVLGNVTYSLSIIFKSTDPEFLLMNLAWLIGSGGTLVFDFVIFAQFYMFS